MSSFFSTIKQALSGLFNSRVMEISWILSISLVIFGFYSSKSDLRAKKPSLDIRNEKPEIIIPPIIIEEQPKIPPKPKKPFLFGEIDKYEKIDKVDIAEAEYYDDKDYRAIENIEEEEKVIDLINLSKKPVIKKRGFPVYPKEAIMNGIEGLVVVELVINKKGLPTNLKVLKGPKILRKAALEAVKQYRFIPGMQRARTVSVKYVIPIKFRLN